MTIRVLITGGLGYLGGRLAAHLAEAGCSIVLGSRNTIEPPVWLPQAKVARIRWEDDAALEQCCKGVDVVIQAAGMNAKECANDPVAALLFNGVATARLVEAACQAGVQRFIYLSTAHVYASPLVGTFSEESNPRNLHPYATSHLAGENAVLSADKFGLIQGIVLRLSNTFGAPMHKNVNCWMLLMNDLCRQAVVTGNMVLYTSGHQHRDFIAMGEVCRVVEKFVVNNNNGIFNVGLGVSESVINVALLIQQRCMVVLGFRPTLHHKRCSSNKSSVSLTYRTERFKKNMEKINFTNNIKEIDILLNYCQKEYGRENENKPKKSNIDLNNNTNI